MKNMQRIEGTFKKAEHIAKEYQRLLSEAIKLGRRHQTKAKYYVPKMYVILLTNGLTPKDAADKLYKDLVGIWQKDTIRRLIPMEAKNQVARERQALSRRSLSINKAGSILRTDDDRKLTIELEKENARLRKRLDDLSDLNRSQLEKILRLEKTMSTTSKGDLRNNREGKLIAITLPPHLFMKTFTLMRSCLKPLVLKVEGNEVIDIDRTGYF